LIAVGYEIEQVEKAIGEEENQKELVVKEESNVLFKCKGQRLSLAEIGDKVRRRYEE
jgi:hypothetical protein